ncbi:MAG: hypothetical protein Q7T91_12330 [Sulfuricurvum sp.]|nr:hypothetical protein [Sulfuricurvum sp.]
MTNPITELLSWFDKQDNDIKQDIAHLIAYQHPSFDIYNMPLGDLDQFVEDFRSRIQEFSESKNGLGFIISFRALFDFIFANKRGTIEGWNEVRRLFESMLTEPNMIELAQKQLADIPAKQEKWFSICNQWSKLKSSALSDEVIDSWNNRIIFTSNQTQI